VACCGDAVSSVVELFREIHCAHRGLFNPIKLLRELKKHDSMFLSGCQEDVHEAILSIFKVLDRKMSSVAPDVFGGKIVTTMTCKTCGSSH
jgi:hypothetical protein